MAFLRKRPFLNQFIQVRTCTFSMLWRRNSSFRQVMPKFPYPSAVNITRHQVVKPRSPPTSPDNLAQMYASKYMTPKLTKRKSKNYLASLGESDKNRLDESKEKKKTASMLKSEQLRKLMLDSDSDESSTSARFKNFGSRTKKPMPTVQQTKQQPKQQQLSMQQQQLKWQQYDLNLQQVQKFYSEHHSEKKPEFASNREHREQPKKIEASITLLRPRPPKQQQKEQARKQQHQPLQQMEKEEIVEKQVFPVEVKNFRKKFKDHQENMQKIKERDRKLKDQVERLKIFDRMNQLLKQQQEQDKKELTPYEAPSRPKDGDYHSNRLKSSRGQTQVFSEHLPPLTHPVYTSRFKQTLDFGPYTPTNEESDNGDVDSKQQHKSTAKLCPTSEYHRKKAVALEADRQEQANCRESAIYKLCKHLNSLPNPKY